MWDPRTRGNTSIITAYFSKPSFARISGACMTTYPIAATGTRLYAKLFTTLPLTKPAATPAYRFLFFMLSASRLRRGADLDLCWQPRCGKARAPTDRPRRTTDSTRHRKTHE